MFFFFFRRDSFGGTSLQGNGQLKTPLRRTYSVSETFSLAVSELMAVAVAKVVAEGSLCFIAC